MFLTNDISFCSNFYVYLYTKFVTMETVGHSSVYWKPVFKVHSGFRCMERDHIIFKYSIYISLLPRPSQFLITYSMWSEPGQWEGLETRLYSHDSVLTKCGSTYFLHWVVQHRTQEHRSNNVHLVLVIIMWGECVWLDCIIIRPILCPHAWCGKGTHKTTMCARNMCVLRTVSVVPQYTTIVVWHPIVGSVEGTCVLVNYSQGVTWPPGPHCDIGCMLRWWYQLPVLL